MYKWDCAREGTNRGGGRGGATLVRQWSNSGKTLVRPWCDSGETMAQHQHHQHHHSATSSKSTNTLTMKLLTFNIWGLKYVSKYRKQRVDGIIQKLLDPSEDYDVIALQEVWVEEDWKAIESRLGHIYHYRRYFNSGIISGPGLAILSKIPIKETFLYRFPLNGRPSAVHRGDWYVGKSLAVTVLSNGIAVLNSHMHAPYHSEGDANYLCHRGCQAWDISKFVGLLKAGGYSVVMVGDLNSRPESLPYRLFTTGTQLVDSWEQFKVKNKEELISLQELAKLSPKDQVIKAAVTCDSQLNSWRAHRKLEEACRLDYALIDGDNLTTIDACVKFIDRLPHYNCSYSDHFGYYVELKKGVSDGSGDDTKDDNTINNNTINNNTKTSMIENYKELLAEINCYQTKTIPFQERWRYLHFFASIIVFIGAIIGTGFVSVMSPFFSILIVVLLPLIVVSGVINGLIAFLGIRSENRALNEVKCQVNDSLGAIVNGY